jgi:ferric-chelate reductase [NAD(P)H]
MNLTALHRISYGLYVTCSRNEDKINGQIVNSLFQVSADPPIVAVSINKQNLTHEYIQKSNIFASSVLSRDTPMTFIGTFGFKSGRNIDKFKGVHYRFEETGVPIILDNTTAYYEARVINKIDVGTHTIFLGKVQNADILGNGQSLTYEYYHQIKGGLSPKTAPTYSKVVDAVITKRGRKNE